MRTRSLLLPILFLVSLSSIAAAGPVPLPVLMPVDPRVGEDVIVAVPGAWAGCQAPGGSTVEYRDGESIITVWTGFLDKPECLDARPYGAPPLQSVKVGKLPLGRYRVVHGGDVIFRFTVRPAGEGVGSMSVEDRIRAAIVEKLRPGWCFGMANALDLPLVGQNYRNRSPQLFLQLRALHPTWTDGEIGLFILRMDLVTVRLVGKRFTYELRSGRCCSIETRAGSGRMLWGTIVLGASRLVKSEHVLNIPCEGE